MTTRTPIALGSDIYSLLVPAFRFDSAHAANAYSGSPAFVSDNLCFGDRYETIHVGERCSYVPRVRTSDVAWDTNEMLQKRDPANERRRSPDEERKWNWDVFRDVGTAMPEDANNVALLVSGPRQFCRHNRHTVKLPPFWYTLSDGLTDCYVVWQPLGKDRQLAPCKAHPSVVAARSAKGVMFGKTAIWDEKGNRSGGKVFAVGLEFSLVDRDASRSGMIKWQLHRASVRSHSVNREEELRLYDVDDSWVKLLDLARRMYDQHCTAVPAELEKWRVWFLDQRSKLIADGKIYDGTSFKSKVENLGFQEALDAVKEAWHLKVVVGTHAYNREFEEAGYGGSRNTRVGNMLSKYECSKERRDELRKMLSDFATQLDHGWSYCGD